MKKLLAFAMLAVSALAVAPSFAAECAGPVSTDCEITHEDGTIEPCTVYVNLGDAGVEGSTCIYTDAV